MATPAPLPVAHDPATDTLTLTLEANQGPMVVLDHELIRRLEATLRALPAAASGLVLASGSPRVFVAGADLKLIAAMSTDELDRYLAFGQDVFAILCGLPFPTVAALNGAALGGGLELAMHCDGLVAAPPGPGKDGAPGKPYPIGLPEAGLAICPGWGGTNLLPARMNPADAIRRTATGRTMLLDEALSCGLVERLAPSPAALLETARAWLAANRHIHGQRRDHQPLRWIGRPATRNQTLAALADDTLDGGGTDQGRACLAAVRAGLESGWPAALAVERRELNRLRAAPAGKAAVEAFLNRGK